MAIYELKGIFIGTITRIGGISDYFVSVIISVLFLGLAAIFAVLMTYDYSMTYIQHNLLDSNQCSGDLPQPGGDDDQDDRYAVILEGCSEISLSRTDAQVPLRISIESWNRVFDRRTHVDWGSEGSDKIVLVTGAELPVRLSGDYTSPVFTNGGDDAIFAVTTPEGSDQPEITKMFDIVVSPDGLVTTIQPDTNGFARFRIGNLKLVFN